LTFIRVFLRFLAVMNSVPSAGQVAFAGTAVKLDRHWDGPTVSYERIYKHIWQDKSQ
jgi:hypothetical protein